MRANQAFMTDVYLSFEEIRWLLRVIKIAKPKTEDRDVENYLRNIVEEN